MSITNTIVMQVTSHTKLPTGGHSIITLGAVEWQLTNLQIGSQISLQSPERLLIKVKVTRPLLGLTKKRFLQTDVPKLL